MGQADLGVRVFLIDNLTSPMGLLTSAMGLFGSGIVSAMSMAGGMSNKLDALGQSSLLAGAELTRLQADALTIEEAYNNGSISLGEASNMLGQNAVAQDAANAKMLEGAAAADGLNTQIDQLTGVMGLFAGALGAGIDFAAFVGGLQEADKAASDLTDTLNAVSIAGNLNNDQLALMQTYLMSVANTSIYTADTVGQGFSMLLEKGQASSDVMRGMGQDAVNLAEALGEKGASNSAELLAGTLQMFNLKATDSRKVADMLTFAFYNGIPSVDGLNAALNATGGMANAMNVPLNETLVMLDALGKAGLSGSQAGTAFRYVLQSMYEPTQKQANELETLGIIMTNQVTPAFEKLYAQLRAGDSSLPKYDGTVNGLYNIFTAAKKIGELPASATFLQWADSLGMLSNKFYDANGKQIDFMKAFGILVQSIKDHSKTPQDFADTLSQMFNVRSGQGFADILGHVSGLTDAQKKLLIATENQGLAAEDARKKMDSQSAATKALQTTFTDFLALVGQPVQDFFKNLFNSLNHVLGGFTTASPQVHQFFTAFLIAGAVVSLIALLVIGFMALSAATAMLDIALGPIILVVLAVAVGVALLAGGIALLVGWIQRTPIIQQIFQQIGSIIMGVLMPTIHQLWTTFQQAWKDIVAAIQPILPALKIVGMIIGGVVVVAILLLVGIITGAVAMIGQVIQGLIHIFVGLVTFFSGLLQFLHGFWDILTGLFTLNGDKLSKGWNELWSGLGTMLKGIGTMLWGVVQGVFGGIFAGILGFLQGFLKSLGTMLIGIPNNFVSAFGMVLTMLNPFNWGAKLIGMIGDGIHSALSNLGKTVGNVGQVIKNFLGFHSPTDEGPGSDADTWSPNLMRMYTQGILAGTPGMHSAALKAANLLHGAFTSPAANGINSAFSANNAMLQGGNTTIPLSIDGQVVSQVVLNRISGQLVLSGAPRTFK